MTFETKEQVLEQVLNMEKPACPHCQKPMSLWEVPEINFSDGLGWGTPYLFVCFNNLCPVYVQGWNNLEENYGAKASYRCMVYPGTDTHEYLPVFSPVGATGQIIDDEEMLQREALKEAVKKGFSLLADCYVAKDWPVVLKIVIDAAEPSRVRLKAAEMIGDIGEPEAIEPLKNRKFGNAPMQEAVNRAVKKIHERFFTRECPFCAETVKQRAVVCKHCGKDIAGQ